MPKSSVGVLNRVLKSNEDLKKQYGRTALNIAALARFMTPAELKTLVDKYGQNLFGGPVLRVPSAIEEKWWAEHLNYPNMSRYAREVAKIDPAQFRSRMHRVAYYKLVVKSERI